MLPDSAVSFATWPWEVAVQTCVWTGSAPPHGHTTLLHYLGLGEIYVVSWRSRCFSRHFPMEFWLFSETSQNDASPYSRLQENLQMERHFLPNHFPFLV